jgi:hypothetical protein
MRRTNEYASFLRIRAPFLWSFLQNRIYILAGADCVVREKGSAYSYYFC